MNDFYDHMKNRFGCSDAVISRWILFAEECVDMEQYPNFIPAPKAEAIEKWLQEIYATLCLVKIEGGDALANAIMELTKEHCLYPYEIAGTLQLLTLGIEPDNLVQKSVDGKLEIGVDFEKKFDLKYVRSLDYDAADEYFKNYKCRFNIGKHHGKAGKETAKSRRKRGMER